MPPSDGQSDSENWQDANMTRGGMHIQTFMTYYQPASDHHYRLVNDFFDTHEPAYNRLTSELKLPPPPNDESEGEATPPPGEYRPAPPPDPSSTLDRRDLQFLPRLRQALEGLPACLPGQGADNAFCVVCQYECQPDEAAKQLACGHCFHDPECLLDLITSKLSCPTCTGPAFDAGTQQVVKEERRRYKDHLVDFRRFEDDERMMIERHTRETQEMLQRRDELMRRLEDDVQVDEQEQVEP